jgi:sigma-B regulation protein RsbU (phosphoserine phosphatase)
MSHVSTFFECQAGEWRDQLAMVVETMRSMSVHTDPNDMVQDYGARMEKVLRRDRLISLSRRGHEAPVFRVTRDSERVNSINPWTQRDQLPVLHGGLLAELIYGDQPRIIDDLRIADDDPAAPYLAGQRSLMAIPLYDGGVGLNMVTFLRKDANAFRHEQLPDLVWMSNLFGRATHNLVLSARLRDAYEEVDNELKAVANIQRSLLPQELPNIPTLDLAADYHTSRRAGGDYYDVFPLPDDRWGILIADVSGHGTPAAVMMAITHAMAHTYPEPPCPPGRLLARLNAQLSEHYTGASGTFVTAFYGIYDPKDRSLRYASAGHNPPRLKRCSTGDLLVLDGVGGLPLGITPDADYEEKTIKLVRGDQIVFYTDGVTEAFDPDHEMFGAERLDLVLANCGVTAQGLIDAVLTDLAKFTRGRPADDDRTLLVVKLV